jgi:biotin transport system substrate-specific component
VWAPGGLPGAARLLGPTGGYLLAYPLAAAATGWLALRADGVLARVGAAAGGMAVIYAGGLAQLAVITGSLEQAALLGALPFVALDAAKVVLAALIAPGRSTPRALA